MTEDRLKALRKTHMMDSRNCTRVSRSDKEYAYVFFFLNSPLPSDASKHIQGSGLKDPENMECWGSKWECMTQKGTREGQGRTWTWGCLTQEDGLLKLSLRDDAGQALYLIRVDPAEVEDAQEAWKKAKGRVRKVLEEFFG